MRFLTPLLLCTTLLVTGCSWLKGAEQVNQEERDTSAFSEKDFYEVIQDDLDAGFWQTAIENLESLEAQYPFGDYAEQAQLELIYARYRAGDFEAAIASADRFIRLHPQHLNVDYAYYLKGLSYFSKTKGFFEEFMPTDDTKRDPGAARDSLTTFNELLNRYPDSLYAPDARKRTIYIRNNLARLEIHAANYYFLRSAYLAAANRGRYVVENFQETPAVPDGLAVMAQAYYLMQMQDLSDDAVKLLVANYPQHPALDESGNFLYQEETAGFKRSWVNKLTAGLYDKPETIGFDTRHVFSERYKKSGKEATRGEKSWFDQLTFGVFN
ncbi:MAG: outer membrane protein assembly factor BamD [Porticoccus sp.]